MNSTPNNELLNCWLSLSQENGLSEEQLLGLAYFNSAIPTVLANACKDESIIIPLGEVIKDIGKSSSEGANVLYLYREMYFNAVTRDSEINPLDLEGIENDFFYPNINPYQIYADEEFGFFLKSRLTLMLIQRIGKILEDYNINIQEAFELGHYHMNFLLQTSSELNVSKAVIMSNILPHYVARIVEIIPNPDSISLHSDLWIFSKIFFQTISDEFSDDKLFSEWLWYFHNGIFFKSEVGSTEVKSEWSLDDPRFEIKMLEAIMATLPSFFKINDKVGNQAINTGKGFEKWEEFFPLLNDKLREEYEVESPCKNFINMGETCNYLAYKFIASVQTILENRCIDK